MTAVLEIQMSDPPREHIEREPLPWRDVTLTECGLEIAGLKHVITQAEFKEKLSKQGKARASFTTCMTCWQTALRWSDEYLRGTGPASALERELMRRDARRLLERELYAIANLIETHREEFDSFVAGLEETVSLADRRAARRHAGHTKITWT